MTAPIWTNDPVHDAEAWEQYKSELEMEEWERGATWLPTRRRYEDEDREDY